ncbi:MAG: hypoxanthine phosphoribosyltransferase [Actinomycetia bacterium]|nr:hypoxanthine phosphoribosyltransferase [Actinomycetes bacterium]
MLDPAAGMGIAAWPGANHARHHMQRHKMGVGMSKAGRLFGPGAASELFTSEQIAEQVAALGRTLTADYRGRTPVVVGIMFGSVVFLADLVRHMDMEMEIEFLMIHRYGEGSNISIAMDLFSDIGGRDVIIVIGLVDTGFVLTAIRKLLAGRSPASLATVALLDRRVRRLVDAPLEYRGFEVGDDFLIGYGLDWEGRYRGVPSIWTVHDPAALQTDPHILDRSVFSQQ